MVLHLYILEILDFAWQQIKFYQYLWSNPIYSTCNITWKTTSISVWCTVYSLGIIINENNHYSNSSIPFNIHVTIYLYWIIVEVYVPFFRAEIPNSLKELENMRCKIRNPSNFWRNFLYKLGVTQILENLSLFDQKKIHFFCSRLNLV